MGRARVASHGDLGVGVVLVGGREGGADVGGRDQGVAGASRWAGQQLLGVCGSGGGSARVGLWEGHRGDVALATVGVAS